MAIWLDVQNRWCMRHMAANFYEHFKNKDLMNLFKRLCNQNQQRKFNALWKVLDELSRKHTEQVQPSSSSIGGSTHSKPFTHWIRDAPKEKWALLYDTNAPSGRASGSAAPPAGRHPGPHKAWLLQYQVYTSFEGLALLIYSL